MSLSLDSIPLGMNKVEDAITWSIEFFQGGPIHDHEALLVLGLEHHLLRIHRPIVHFVHLKVSAVHVPATHLDLAL